MQYAPIALFTYSRADHTQRAVESLLQNAEAAASDLFIFSDGPKTEEKRAAVEENRRYIHSVTGFKSVTIIEREKNWGLANSLIAGITEVISQYGKVIVVEDDLILSPYFLKFMNDGLEKYENEDKVSSITGFVPPVNQQLPNTYFLHYFHCWGWATWKRSWDLLITDSKFLLRKLRFRKNEFDIEGSMGNYGILYCHKVGLVDSWYIRLYASFFLAEKLTLFPGFSLVSNGGLDSTGVHCGEDTEHLYSSVCYMKPIEVDDIEIKEDIAARKIYHNHYVKQKKNSFTTFFERMKSFLRRLLFIDCM